MQLALDLVDYEIAGVSFQFGAQVIEVNREHACMVYQDLDAVIGQRSKGVLISNGAGKALSYSLYNLQERGSMFLDHGDEVYEGMLVGIHARDNDLVVNPLKGKQLTNVRASGTDEALILTPPIKMTLEQALEFIDDDELVEVTPNFIRTRKKLLTENERKRASR